MGRDWLAHLQLDWKHLADSVNHLRRDTSVKLQGLLKRHQDVFTKELGVVHNLKASLTLKEGA